MRVASEKIVMIVRYKINFIRDGIKKTEFPLFWLIMKRKGGGWIGIISTSFYSTVATDYLLAYGRAGQGKYIKRES